jgi:hypothetical protein
VLTSSTRTSKGHHMTHLTSPQQHEAGGYDVRAKGHLDRRWDAWFDGQHLTYESDGTTVIHCPVLDQAAVYSVLLKLRDLGLPLVSVTQVAPELSATPTISPR